MENMFRLSTVINTADVIGKLWNLADALKAAHGQGSWEVEACLSAILHVIETERSLDSAMERNRSLVDSLTEAIDKMEAHGI